MPPAFRNLASLVLTFLFVPAHSWGHAGHEIVGYIADQLLDESAESGASSFVNEVLSNSTLQDVANWADTITKTESWSLPLHFINVQVCDDDSCVFVPSRDCPGNTCVFGAVNNYTQRTLAQHSETLFDDLKFLTHFVGDIHQPLHCAKDADKGGNTIKPIYYDVTDQGSEFSLHQIWDFGIIENVMAEEYNGDVTTYGDYLLSLIQTDFSDEVEDWKCDTVSESTCAESWGQESVDTAMKYAYLDMQGNEIESEYEVEKDYAKTNRNVIEKRLAMGGVRLANIIELIVSKK